MQQRVSIMTGFQSGINEDVGGPFGGSEHDPVDGFQFGEQNNTDKSYNSRRTDLAKQTIKP